MTERPVSLFVITVLDEEADEEEAHSMKGKASKPGKGGSGGSCDYVKLGLQHEGFPCASRFLAGQLPRLNPLRRMVTGCVPDLVCTSTKFRRKEVFRWWKDGSIQHAETGYWLYEPTKEVNQIFLHAMQRSYWEALPAL